MVDYYNANYMTYASFIIFQSILHSELKLMQHMGCNGQISVRCLQSDLIYLVFNEAVVCGTDELQ